jgi:carbonic anhydrase/acetyltransferase-like protein (isoleucine patch superfamily)
MIGIHSTVLNGVKIGNGSIIGANALVTTNMEIPENSLVLGIPGKIIKQNKIFRDKARKNAEEYQRLSKEHLEGKHTSYKLNE